MKLYLCLLLIILLNKCPSDASGRGPSLNTTDAVSKAVNYLLKRTEAENGAENVMARTVVALGFAARRKIIPDSMLSSLRKKLNNQIYMHLSQTHPKPSLFDLAQYVNALYATCQDPRSFNGMNLVAQLREGVECALKEKSKEVPPFPLLTLCIAGDRRRDDYSTLDRAFSHTGNDRLGLKALMVMALACYSSNNARTHPEVSGFVRDVRSEFNTTDIYTKGLSLQALNALHAMYKEEADAKLLLLQQQQLPNGSFGDPLSTYYAVPALLSESLLDLRCESSSNKAQPTTHLLWDSFTDASGKVTYSLWIDHGLRSITHSVKVGLRWNETFYDVMKRAEEANEAYNFLYDETRYGKIVYSLAGIPNDAESRMAWNLYQGFEGAVTTNSKKNLLKRTRGVDQIWPRDNDHFVFWFEQDSNEA